GLPPSEAPGVDAAPVGVGDPSRVGGHSDLGQDLLHIPGQAAGQVGHRLPVGVLGEPSPEIVGGAFDLQLHLVVELAQVLLRLGLGLGVCHPGLLLDSLGQVVVGVCGCAGSAAAPAPARLGLVALATSLAVAGLALGLAALLAPALVTGPVALLVAVLVTAGAVLPSLVVGHLFGRASPTAPGLVVGLVVLVDVGGCGLPGLGPGLAVGSARAPAVVATAGGGLGLRSLQVPRHLPQQFQTPGGVGIPIDQQILGDQALPLGGVSPVGIPGSLAQALGQVAPPGQQRPDPPSGPGVSIGQDQVSDGLGEQGHRRGVESAKQRLDALVLSQVVDLMQALPVHRPVGRVRIPGSEQDVGQLVVVQAE